MKDLDFDELDRAVASVLSDDTAPVSAEPGDPEIEMPATPSPSISSHAVHARIMPGATPAARSSSVVTRQEQAPTPVQTATKRVIPHREGRFMDVVHPGSQAKKVPAAATSEPTTPDPASPVASGPANVDLENAINELLVSEGHAPVTAEVSHTSASEETPIPETPAPETRMPEMATPDTTAIDTIAAALEKPVEAIDEPTSQSPFLPDAKVEKRPLGTAEITSYVPPTPSPATEAIAEATADISELHTPPVINEEETPMPEELQNNLLAIESGAVQSVETSAPETEAPEASSGPTAIARQYKDTLKKASEDDESGAIFDPGTYQQPIEQPAKKSASWVWIVVILIVIILAVVAAVAAWLGGVLPVPL